jgi:FkbM family methyltransferase
MAMPVISSAQVSYWARSEEQLMNQVETRYGPILVPPADGDMICRFLHRYGEWAFNEARFIARNVPEDARILDIGAFLGTFGLGVALERRIREVCFVEANPAITPLLRANVEANCRVPATVVEAIVTSATEAPRIGRYTPGNLSSLSFSESGGSSGRSEIELSVSVISLEQLLAEHGKFDLIKIDAEGMELDILSGSPAALARPDIALWLECNDTPRSLELARVLLDNGYSVFYFAFPSFSPDNFLGSPDPIFPFSFEAGLLCTHDWTPTLDERLRANGCILVDIENKEDLRRAMWGTPRWGPRDWINRPIEQVVAFAGHALRGESYDSFLEAGSDRAVEQEVSAAELHLIRVNRLQQALAEAQREVRAARDDQVATEAKLADAQRLAAERAADVQRIIAQFAEVQRLSEQRLIEADQTRAERDAALLERLGQIAQEFKSEIDHATARLEQLSAAHGRTASLAEGRRVLLEKARTSLSQAETQLNSARAEVSSVRAEVSSVRAEAERLAARLECTEADLARTKAQREAAELLVARVRRNLVWRAIRPVRLLLQTALRESEEKKHSTPQI